jgi:energy-coupling factor transport system permease protein
MDARGYGRRGDAAGRARRLATGATVAGLLLAAVGVYGVTDAGSEFGLGLPLLAVAAVLCAVGFVARGRRLQRSRYRPDRWGAAEWLIVGSGLVALGAMALAQALQVPGMVVSFQPLAVPPLPLLPVAGILVAALPALVVPSRRPVPASPRQELEAMVAA